MELMFYEVFFCCINPMGWRNVFANLLTTLIMSA